MKNLKGLKKAVSAIKYKNLITTIQVSVDMKTGQIYTDEHVGNSWSQYHDTNVITVCRISNDKYLTMAQLEDVILNAIHMHELEKTF